MSTFTPTVTGSGPRAAIQRFGAFLAGMIMPNLGAFIAWGLITAVTIQNGWINLIARAVGAIPQDGVVPFASQISTVVGPIIVFLLPTLIGYTGGRQVHGQRGAVVGAIATLGAVVAPLALGYIGAVDGTTIGGDAVKLAPTIANLGPNFLAGLIMGPLAAVVLKAWDRLVDGKLASGFEMLVDNFSAGIIGGIMAIIGIYVLGPIIFGINAGLGGIVDFLVETRLLPLASIIVEPAKVLFLNNAIGNGVLVPLGIQQAQGGGTSVLFMIESNPGPGLGILTAMLLFGPLAVRPTVPSAMIVHFLGGIHEIYFPYVLMKPILVIAAILGGGMGVLTFVVLGGGLIAPASPGSIIAYILVSAPGTLLPNLIGVIVSAVVAFVIGSLLLGFGRGERTSMSLDEANAQNARNKGRKTAVAGG